LPQKSLKVDEQVIGFVLMGEKLGLARVRLTAHQMAWGIERVFIIAGRVHSWHGLRDED
jgi:hypothetical protein